MSARKRIQAFTLIEIAVVIIVLGIVSGIMGELMYQAFRGANIQYDEASVSSQARIVLDRMSRELRMIRVNSDLSTMTASSVTFKNVSGDEISYSLSGTTLLRNLKPIADSVSGLTFEYLDATGAVTTTNTDVRYIRVTLQMSKNEELETLATTVFLRNFGEV